MIPREPDPYRFTTIAHAGRALLGPVSDESVGALLARIPKSGAPARILDVGCGKGVILARALDHIGGTAIGIEPNPAFAREARELAAQCPEPDAIRIIETKLEHAELPEHAFTLGICTGALHAFGDWRAALEGMAKLVTANGWALLGPGYWKQDPDAEYLAAFGGSADEMHSLLATTAIARRSGWDVVACHESTAAEWDAYEHAYAARIREWGEAHDSDPDAKPFRDRIDRWSAAYERWGRETMGYALMLLRRAG